MKGTNTKTITSLLNQSNKRNKKWGFFILIYLAHQDIEMDLSCFFKKLVKTLPRLLRFRSVRIRKVIDRHFQMVSSPFSQYNEYIDSARKMANHDKKVWTKTKKLVFSCNQALDWKCSNKQGRTKIVS